MRQSNADKAIATHGRRELLLAPVLRVLLVVPAEHEGRRDADQRVQEARRLDELLTALATVFARGEFDDVALFLRTPPGGVERSWRLHEHGFVEQPAPRRRDEWEVVCPFSGVHMEGELVLRRRLGRRSLLLDLNLLVEILQPALERAAARLT